jgi:hypothetical protein
LIGWLLKWGEVGRKMVEGRGGKEGRREEIISNHSIFLQFDMVE